MAEEIIVEEKEKQGVIDQEVEENRRAGLLGEEEI